jgi:ribosomal protein S18 acetylase RimI-like enzyme
MTTLNNVRNIVKIIPFEKCHQEQVAKLFREGLTGAYVSKGETMVKLQEWYVNDKLSRDTGGDMHCIWDSYNMQNRSKDETDCTNFWVAYEDSTDKVVGCVGLTNFITSQNHRNETEKEIKEVGEFYTCELQRMSVDKECRGQNLGKRLCSTVEEFAIHKGMRKLIVSTLSDMDLARKLYERCGYKFIKETQISEKHIIRSIGPGNWTKMFVSHYEKNLNIP